MEGSIEMVYKGYGKFIYEKTYFIVEEEGSSFSDIYFKSDNESFAKLGTYNESFIQKNFISLDLWREQNINKLLKL